MSAKVDIKFTKLFINNEFVNSASGKTFPTYNPATEEVIAQVQEGDKEDIDRAVKAAKAAFQIGSEWRSMDASARGEMLLKLAKLMRRDEEYIAKLESLNNGKTIGEARFDIDYSIKCFEYFAGWSDKIFGKTIPVDGPFFTYTRHEPIGVCGQIIPYSYPILFLSWKLGAALACGNTLILKPSEHTPLSALYIGSLVVEAGFPPGVVNIVPGLGPKAGHALASHLDVQKIAFQGTTAVGRLIKEASAKSNLKRVSLELGGKSPFIIFDVDDETLQKAADDAAASVFGQQQSCCSCTRIYVHEKVHDKFVEKLKALAESRVAGDPFDEKSTNGAITSGDIFNRILEYIKSGKEEGARVVSGGQRVGTKGFFIQPTVFADVKDNMKIAREEILGPVACILKFTDVNDVIERANDTPYGLAAGVYTNDINRVFQVTNALDAGTIWVNCYEVVPNQAPFGGFKQSGSGRELGDYILDEYTEVKNVTIKQN